MLRLLKPTWMTDQEWLVTKIGVLYTLAFAMLLLLWWKGYLREVPK